MQGNPPRRHETSTFGGIAVVGREHDALKACGRTVTERVDARSHQAVQREWDREGTVCRAGLTRQFRDEGGRRGAPSTVVYLVERVVFVA